MNMGEHEKTYPVSACVAEWCFNPRLVDYLFENKKNIFFLFTVGTNYKPWFGGLAF
jgi:hypothetical protein